MTQKSKDSIQAATTNAVDAKKEDEGKKVEEFSAAIMIFFNVIYGFAGLGVSLVNKKTYAWFGDIDPMNLLFVQTIVNFSLCIMTMGLKAAGMCEFTVL